MGAEKDATRALGILFGGLKAGGKKAWDTAKGKNAAERRKEEKDKEENKWNKMSNDEQEKRIRKAEEQIYENLYGVKMADVKSGAVPAPGGPIAMPTDDQLERFMSAYNFM